jgi:predicted DCC family thiol-disulfide oxidoreductase YuxK
MTVGIDNVVIFDGICKLCAHSVRFILANERDHVIRFAAMQSPSGQELLHRLGFNQQNVTTFVFVKGGAIHVRSDAALEVARHLRLPWRVLRVLGAVPRPLRDCLYDAVTRNRYRWFGKLESCIVPSPELRARFIGE